MGGGDAFDVSSLYLGQRFGESVMLRIGKINVIDLAAARSFAGGAGIDSFWSLAFAAPPTGVLPPTILGATLNVRTDLARFGLWIYDPNSAVNRTGFEAPFADGITFRGTVDVPVTIGGLGGRQGIVGVFSTMNGTNLRDVGDPPLPEPGPETAGMKNLRWFFGYVFDQQFYQSRSNPEEGVGVFGQFGISDGNPNKLYWSALLGVGGTGLVRPGAGTVGARPSTTFP